MEGKLCRDYADNINSLLPSTTHYIRNRTSLVLGVCRNVVRINRTTRKTFLSPTSRLSIPVLTRRGLNYEYVLSNTETLNHLTDMGGSSSCCTPSRIPIYKLITSTYTPASPRTFQNCYSLLAGQKFQYMNVWLVVTCTTELFASQPRYG